MIQGKRKRRVQTYESYEYQNSWEGAPSQPQKESAPNLNLSTAQKFHIRRVLVVPGNWKGLGGGTKGTFSFSFSTFLALEEALGPASSSRFRGGITWQSTGKFQKGASLVYPLVICCIAMENGRVIVDSPPKKKSGDFPVRYVSLPEDKSPSNTIQPPLTTIKPPFYQRITISIHQFLSPTASNHRLNKLSNRLRRTLLLSLPKARGHEVRGTPSGVREASPKLAAVWVGHLPDRWDPDL